MNNYQIKEVKKMVQNLKMFLDRKLHFLIKLCLSMFLLALAFLFLYNPSTGFSHVPTDIPFLENTITPPPRFSSLHPLVKTQEISQDMKEEHCNLFIGDWVYKESDPLSTHETCIFIDEPQNCIKNGRLDTSYLHWRWNPRGCDLPRFDPLKFLELMRNRSMGLIGDSISRNHVQSLVCVLSTVENAVLVYHDESFKTRRWIFPTYNFTISIIWSPLLAKADIFEDQHGVSSSEIVLHLDILDNAWTERFNSLDYTIFSTGAWFLKSAIYYENKTIIGCKNCPDQRNLTELDFAFAYRKILGNLFDNIVSSNHKGMIFYRTTTSDHFEGGQWSNGGTCNRTIPVKENEFELKEVDRILHEIEVEEFNKASDKAYEKDMKLKLFDVTYLSLLRPDGHPGSDRYFQKIGKEHYGKAISDCLHWCVPGVIDHWNDLLMEMLVNG